MDQRNEKESRGCEKEWGKERNEMKTGEKNGDARYDDRGMRGNGTCTSQSYVSVQTEARDNGYEEWIYQSTRVGS